MLTKINQIHSFGVFNSFDWNASVRDKGNNIGEFKKLNILYGRNYSGKTTLSRIIQCLEKRKLHDKYPFCTFEIVDSENGLLNHRNLSEYDLNVRVYNEDFVKDNLQWLIDEQGEIKPFAVIGAKNLEIEKEIKQKEDLLGTKETKKGYNYELELISVKYESKKKEKEMLQVSIDNRLRDKANQDIKRNPIYKNVTYNIDKIKADINLLSKNPKSLMSRDQVTSLLDLLKEDTKLKINPIPLFSPKLPSIHNIALGLSNKKIKPSVPIQELLNDAILASWVRNGIEYHRGKRIRCGFCGQNLPEDLWNRLDAHFSKESEDLREAILDLITTIEQEEQKVKALFTFKKDQFYSIYKDSFDKIKDEWNIEIAKYCNNLDKLRNELNARIDDIFRVRIIDDISDNSNSIKTLQQEFNLLLAQNNDKSDTLTKGQDSARTELRLDEVAKFINNIAYYDNLKKLDKLIIEERKLLEEKNKIVENIKMIVSDIKKLRIQMIDEKKGADKVNQYLCHYFGHDSLKLVAQEGGKGYEFNIQRGDEIAYNLSEGERSLVAFCYFMARLEDSDSEGKKLIIWIDDPVSSLDGNHIFFVFSLIENIIAKPFKSTNGANEYNYKQLFISTHNLEFLKYLRRLSHPKNENEYFLIERKRKNSRLNLMPNYLREYITEFNYLFHQIYKCANQTPLETEHDCFYNFGNNLRKFLEAYLFYKYPSKENIKDKLHKYFSDDKVSLDITNRIDNEFSHLENVFDRSMKPIDIPEIPKLAQYILNKINEKDKDQYSALLESIGVKN